MIARKLRLLQSDKEWAEGPRHRDIFMLAVGMLTAVCKPKNVATIEHLATMFDKLNSETNAFDKADLAGWPVMSTDYFLVDGTVLWQWLVHSDRRYADLANIPHAYHRRFVNRAVAKYDHNLIEKFTNNTSRLVGPNFMGLEIEDSSGLIVRTAMGEDPNLLAAIRQKIVEYDSIVEALYNCMYSPQENRDFRQRLRQAAGSNLCKQILEMASYITSNPNDRSVCGMYADALDEMGATAAAQHMRTKTHCRACWAVTSL